MAVHVSVPLNVSAPIIYYYYNLVKRIQRRLVAIIMSLPDRVKYKRIAKPKESGEPLDSLVSQSSHVVYLQFGRYQCARCLNSFNAKDKSLCAFLKSRCASISGSGDKPVPLSYDTIPIGNKVTHYSHKL